MVTTNDDNALNNFNLPELLKDVSVSSMEDVHDAAVKIKEIADQCGFRIALCDDISSRDPMVDAEGTVLSADIFGWLNDGERWWEEHCLALHSPVVRACRYENEPFWCNRDGLVGHAQNPYIEGIETKTYWPSSSQSICLSRKYQPTAFIHLMSPKQTSLKNTNAIPISLRSLFVASSLVM